MVLLHDIKQAVFLLEMEARKGKPRRIVVGIFSLSNLELDTPSLGSLKVRAGSKSSRGADSEGRSESKEERGLVRPNLSSL